ncbi:toxin-antitoxin system HicB family antitoxin [Crenothrix sp.]|uniref:toxin-antitoxin system HicB family antitoxin n=1 Tax=Crenothrix sp. TaxID=3100433 RepID=UPI00374DB421
MSALTLRLPEQKHQRLKALAKSKGMSVNHLLEEVTTLILAEFDLKTQFEIRAQRGQEKAERGQELLNKAKTGFSE